MFGKVVYAIWRFISVTRDVDMGESYKLRRILCHYAVKYADPTYEVPEDVVRDASERLTAEEQGGLSVLGELREEFKGINNALEYEFVAMDDKGKKILLANANDGNATSEPFSNSMSLFERLLWGALTFASTGWDMYLGFTGPDQSLLPRSSGYAITTISGAIGFLGSPTANRMQYLETIFMDRAIFGTPHRSFYTAGSAHKSFYENEIPYLTGVSVAAAFIVLGWTLPPAIKKKLDDRTMNKIGGRAVPHEQLGAHNAIKADAKRKADKLQELERKLEHVADKWLAGDGTDDQITRIRSQTNRQAELFLRATNQFVPKKHAEHMTKAGYMGLWNATIGGILYAARKNLGQIGVLVPYIVHAERSMWEVFFDFTQGAEAMRKLYVRLGAPIFYQLWCISVPLLKRGADAFNDSKLKRQITAILITINATVIRHTPFVVDGIFAFGGWLFRCGRKPAAVAPSGTLAIETAGADLDPNANATEAAVGISAAEVALVTLLFEEEMLDDPCLGDGQYLIDVSEFDEGELHL
jgi:hypothetical protein